MPAAGRVLQDRQEDAGAVDDAPEVHVDDPAPVGLGEVGDAPERADARVVDDDVDGAEALHRRVGEGLDAAAVADVGLDGERAEVVGGPVQRRHLDVADHELRAGRGQAAGDAQPDARRAAGDHRNLAVQIRDSRHVLSPVVSNRGEANVARRWQRSP